MHRSSLVSPAETVGDAVRHADRHALAAALRESRADTLATFAVCAEALADRDLPRHESLNPPLWELGHIGWFQEVWVGRNPERSKGTRADPDAPRGPAMRAEADALYDSSRVPHASRAALPLPDAAATREDLSRQLETTLALLADASEQDALYFFRLALLHEDMHHEAALMMAQLLGVAIVDPRWQPALLADARRPLRLDAGRVRLGGVPAGAFAFDNELGAHDVELAASSIDSRVLSWAEYLPFVESGGYARPVAWSDAGCAWLATERPAAPRHLRRRDGGWEHCRYGRWSALDLALPACHLTAFEADAWCRWAGRRLPTEAEWERAAGSPDFTWGAVWEWTASAFEPYPGFTPHPYRDYSAPWFGSRTVLRGASFMTQPRMCHRSYRNFFGAHRNDVAAGFRSCAR